MNNQANNQPTQKKQPWWYIWQPRQTGNVKLDLLTGIFFMNFVKETNDLMAVIDKPDKKETISEILYHFQAACI
jgi:hypothetical protein